MRWEDHLTIPIGLSFTHPGSAICTYVDQLQTLHGHWCNIVINRYHPGGKTISISTINLCSYSNSRWELPLCDICTYFQSFLNRIFRAIKRGAVKRRTFIILLNACAIVVEDFKWIIKSNIRIKARKAERAIYWHKQAKKFLRQLLFWARCVKKSIKTHSEAHRVWSLKRKRDNGWC